MSPSHLPPTTAELLPLLYHHCRILFSGSRLPSHDHNHHLRVWNYVTDLLCELSENGNVVTDNEIRQLMIAVFFHDAGLTRTLDISHGLESRKLCQDFLDKNPALSQAGAAAALHAIEFHDLKEALPDSDESPGMDILKVLTVCDDADAYGPVGILRYAEIYLLRGIGTGMLAEKVLKNMAHRFDFLSSQEWIPGNFFRKHQERHRYAAGFYKSLQRSIASGKKDPVGLKIIETYMDQVYYGTSGFGEFAGMLMKSSCRETGIFGRELSAELEQKRQLFPGRDIC